MKSAALRKIIQENPTGQSLDITLESGSSTATAVIFEDKIVVDCSDLVKNTKATIETPIQFKVIDVHTIHYDDNTTKLTIINGSSGNDVMSELTIAGSDTDIDRAGDIDDAEWEFKPGDDDLVVKETGNSNNLKALVVIHIMPT